MTLTLRNNVLLCQIFRHIETPKAMTDSNYIKIFTGEVMEVQKIILELEKQDIIPVVREQTDSGLLPIFGMSNSLLKQIYVHKDEHEKAMLILKNLNLELP